MISSNFFIFLDKYSSKLKKQFIKKKNIKIKIFNRTLVTTDLFNGLTLAVHNGLFFIPVIVDINKINYMLAVFSFSFSIKLKKKIKVYKKKKKNNFFICCIQLIID